MTLFCLDQERAIWRDIDGEAVIINADTSVYYSLNRTGTAILSQVASGPCSLEGLARYVTDTYAVAPEDATVAVRALLEQLQTEGLLGLATGEEKPRTIAGESSDPWEAPTLTRHGELERLVLSGE